MVFEKTLNAATVVFPLDEGRVLLAKKGSGIGLGCWNGFGGGIEEGESPDQTAVRELEEEGGLIAEIPDLEKVAIVDFHNNKSDGSAFVCTVHMYFVKSFSGEVMETLEMLTPTWFDIKSLPLDEMMPADRAWLPLVLAGKKLRAEAHYGPFQKELLAPVLIQEIDIFDR